MSDEKNETPPPAEPAQPRSYTVEYTVRGVVGRVCVVAQSREEAIERARLARHWGRNFRIAD